MNHDHSHHDHSIAEEFGKNVSALSIVFFMTVMMMFIEFVGGFMSGSLALVSDAGHMFTDSAALGLALFALWFSRKPSDQFKTYGFYRAEILASLLNGSVLVALSFYIFYEALLRFFAPKPIQAELMLVVAMVGLIANVIGVLVLARGSKGNLNVKGAFLHVASDAVSSLGVVIGGLVIAYTGLNIVDPIIGCIIAILILRSGFKLVQESVDILLESTPKDIDIRKMVKMLKRKITGIKDIHDIHVWTITSGLRALSAHVLTRDAKVSQCGRISQRIKDILKKDFSISHVTLEYECKNCEEGMVCRIKQ